MLKVVRCVLIGLTLLASATASVALDYPSKPVRVVVPFASGTGADLAARIIADKLAKSNGKGGFKTEAQQG